MVGGLVENKEIGVTGKHPDKLEACFLATRQTGHPQIAINRGVKKILRESFFEGHVIDLKVQLLIGMMNCLFEGEVEVSIVYLL